MPGPILPLVPVLIGLAGLWIGAALAVRGAGRLLGRSTRWEAWLGAAVAGIGTALPELGIVGASLWLDRASGPAASSLIVGTVLGSVLVRTTLVLGLAALVGAAGSDPTDEPRATRPLLALSLLLLAALGLDESLGRTDGAVLCGLWGLHQFTRLRGLGPRPEGTAARHDLLPDGVVVVTGFLVVLGAGWLVAQRSLMLSEAWGVAPLLFGLLVLGAGASLPELLHGVGAALTGIRALSVASVLDRGLVGLLLPLGVAALSAPLHLDPEVFDIDLPAVALVVALVSLWGYRNVEPDPVRGAVLVGYFAAFAFLRMVLG